MSQDVRQLLKRVLPYSAKQVIWSLREHVEGPPIDVVVLGDVGILADASEKPRVSLVLPTLARGSDFGGFATGIDLYIQLIKIMNEESDIDGRLVITDAISETDTSIFRKRAVRAGERELGENIFKFSHPDDSLPVRKNEIFLTYNWWTTSNFTSAREAQANHFDQPIKPVIYLIQDYEPHFYSFSSAHMLAREAYDTTPRLWGIFNSSNLKNYFDHQGHSVEKQWTFEPVVDHKLRPFLSRVGDAGREKRILIYGRPRIDRNCFPALIRGLTEWAEKYPEFSDWEIVSAGMPHDPVPIGDGRSIRSLGKLPLEEYAQLLLGSSVGVSLMASPHPSYPPLEMAHFGVRVVTNTYTCKDWTDFHPNIVPIDSMAKQPLADGIAKACRSASQPPSTRQVESYVREQRYPFLGELAAAIVSELT